ncbi:GGDEF domain-containing protein [Novosphingobium album (ex Hu et al. 2023)]|uniref:GGDEF domain-containing protein n=1 Tax=Novosphingobium album (ex Hu et al. 2023) TaxID=2930093 RepID=UPI002E115A91
MLKALAEILMGTCRPIDISGRLGGEEFAMLMPETEAADAFWAAERFRQAVEAESIALPDGKTLQVTASFGIAPLSEATASVEAWLAAADEPLYAAKRGGRNRCVASG